MQSVSACALIALLACHSTSATEPASKWELGVGVGAISTNHYRGADQRRTYAAPLPYVRYHGERLHVDREGGRYYFLNREKLRLDINASFAFPVKSDGNTARSGMENLSPILEVGPRVEIQLWEDAAKLSRWRLGLPLRVAIATDIRRIETAGAVFSPYLQYRFNNGWENAIAIGPMWATEANHDYFYQVDAQYATSERPAYDAHGGYSGTRITLSTSRRFDHYWFALFTRYDSLHNTAFDDSPLRRQNHSIMFGAAFAYVFSTRRTNASITANETTQVLTRYHPIDSSL